MATVTTLGYLRDAAGTITGIVETDIADLPPVSTPITRITEEMLLGEDPSRPYCRAATRHCIKVQQMMRVTVRYFQAVEKGWSFWKKVGVGLIIVGVVIVVGLAVAVSGGTAVPGLVAITSAVTVGAAGTTAVVSTAATLTTLGNIVLGIGFTLGGAGVSMVWGEPDGYEKGNLLNTVGPNDFPNGQPVETCGDPIYGPVHPCMNH